jgi:hypothetical protein
VTAIGGWNDRDVNALAHVVRNGRGGAALTSAVLED